MIAATSAAPRAMTTHVLPGIVGCGGFTADDYGCAIGETLPSKSMKRRWLIGVAILTLSSACGGGTVAVATPKASAPVATPSFSASPAPVAEQRQEPALPVPIEETAAAAAGGKLYVMGGFNAAGASLDGVFVFDGTTWQQGPRLPLPLDHASAASLEGQVYIAGGHSNGRDSARLFRLDADHWTALASMHYARGGHALIADEGKLYAVGGNNASTNVAQVEAYDPQAGSWAVVSSLPVARNHVAGFAIGSRVCVAGGRSPTTNRVDCLDVASGAWSRLPDLPRATSGGGATAFLGGVIVVAGGQNANETAIVDQLTHYAASGWSGAQAMLVPRHGFELAVFDGRAWACGGGIAPGLHPVSTCTSIADPTAATRGR